MNAANDSVADYFSYAFESPSTGSAPAVLLASVWASVQLVGTPLFLGLVSHEVNKTHKVCFKKSLTTFV